MLAASMPYDVQQDVVRHAVQGLPNEACGMLLGHINDHTYVIQKAVLTENAARSPVRFSISAEDTFRAYQTAEAQGMEVVGVYHSHPASPAVPSHTDAKYMDLNPGVWVIRSVSHMAMRAWVLEGTPREISLTYTET